MNRNNNQKGAKINENNFVTAKGIIAIKLKWRKKQQNLRSMSWRESES